MLVPEAPHRVCCACISCLVLHLLPDYLYITLTILCDVPFTWNHGPPRRQTADKPPTTPKRSQSLSIIKINRLIRLRKIDGIYCEHHLKHIITMCKQNSQVLKVRVDRLLVGTRWNCSSISFPLASR